MLTDRLTDPEIRSAQTRVGAGGMCCAAAAAALGLSSSWPLVDSVALVGGAGGSAVVAAAMAHHAWHFAPGRQLRRELGDPLGWLDARDLRESAGASAVRAQAAGLFRHQPLDQHPLTVSGWEVGRLVSGPLHLRRRPVYSPWARGIGILGPQGSGKSQYLSRLVLDAPGAVVVSSTKPELAAATMALRAQLGPVSVFNPLQLGELASTFRWNPVQGCDREQTANQRAAALVRGAGSARGTENSGFWAQKAQEIIRCYLMAAALTDQGMETVLGWANDPGNDTPVRVLERHSGGGGPVPVAWVETLRTHLAASHNTRTGYFATVVSAVNFVDNPVIAAACRPDPGAGLDVARFLASRATLYLVGSVDDARVAPLFTALVEHLFHSAKHAAATAGGVLPTTCAFLLDEVANITPVPLDRWAADSRGWGITVCAVFQSLAQLSTTWGRDAGEVIWQNLPVKVILPGVADTDDLDDLAYLGGKRDVRRDTHSRSLSSGDGDGRLSRSMSTTRSRELVVEGDVISRMPRWHAYVLGLGRHPAVVRYTPGWKLVQRRRAVLARSGSGGGSAA
jgi:type IV secretory pathway TraG/TraD family ATPase VirD4